MKIYCLYGHGKETEVGPHCEAAVRQASIDWQRSYWYMQGEYEQDESRSDAENSEAYVSIPRSSLIDVC
jgi:phospholipid:diacylglycerol acyltransferase